MVSTMKIVLFFIILTWVWILTPVCAKALDWDPDSIKIVTSDYPPFNYLEDNKPTGLCTRIVQAILKDMKINVPIITLPWARAYKMAVKHENTLIYTIARTKEREHLFHWVGVLVTGNSYLFSMKNRHIRFRSLDQAHPYRIGATLSDIRAEFLKSKGILNLDLVVNARMNALKLLNQRIDLWAEDEVAAVYTVRQLGYDPDEILAKAFPLEISPTPKGYLAFGRNTNPAVVKAFQSALKKFLQTSEYKEIKSLYTHESE